MELPDAFVVGSAEGAESKSEVGVQPGLGQTKHKCLSKPAT
jgi:hypothetical protein